ncbi:serine/threonine protein kinase [Flavobacterium limicola]|uniref:Serine/threonine protein kinase n=1 Tax=Flavobacterium limicola TaxID=180441 RepID=A0A495S2F4_9FLAO|nr:serine/threonine-protein kinase [Flavobacterium limicola]RKS93840.1 serine/threonine protein kinase [Flavobacterium limicola]
MTFNIGDDIYKFTLIKKLGGNFGDVWQAFDNSISKEIALKILEPKYEPIAKLLDEARIGNKFNHKNLLPIHYADVTSVGGITFTLISQEYYKNGDVTNYLNNHNFLPLPQTLKVLQDILFGLEYLHNNGFYHNDIKPGNILMDDQSNAVLADYGIAGFSASVLPVTPKNSYIVHRAPESTGTSPVISIHSDIYQVGCTAYRLLNGISSLKNEFISLGEIIYDDKKAQGKIPDSNKYQPFVPSRLKTIINKALNTDPSLRYSSALEMRRKLEKLHFSGYWTTDSRSDLIGIGKKYTYHFEIVATTASTFNLISTKKNNQSGNITKVIDFTKKNLNQKETEKLKNEFISWVIDNAN